MQGADSVAGLVARGSIQYRAPHRLPMITSHPRRCGKNIVTPLPNRTYETDIEWTCFPDGIKDGSARLSILAVPHPQAYENGTPVTATLSEFPDLANWPSTLRSTSSSAFLENCGSRHRKHSPDCSDRIWRAGQVPAGTSETAEAQAA